MFNRLLPKPRHSYELPVVVEEAYTIRMIEWYIQKQLEEVDKTRTITEVNLRQLANNRYMLFAILADKEAYKTTITFDIKMGNNGHDLVTFDQTAEEIAKSLTFHRNVTR